LGPVASCRAHKFFYLGLSGHNQACSVRAPCRTFFFCHSHALVSGRAVFGLPGRIRSAAGRAEIVFWPDRSLFTHPCQPAQQLFCDRLHLHKALSARAARKNLFFCPVTSAQKWQGGRALRNLFSFGLSGRLRAAVCSHKIIFIGAAQLFLLPSDPICAELF
jgi:hypothetical protein